MEKARGFGESWAQREEAGAEHRARQQDNSKNIQKQGIENPAKFSASDEAKFRGIILLNLFCWTGQFFSSWRRCFHRRISGLFGG